MHPDTTNAGPAVATVPSFQEKPLHDNIMMSGPVAKRPAESDPNTCLEEMMSGPTAKRPGESDPNTCLMEEMASLNKEGVAQLIAGTDLQEALNLFGKAIDLLEKVLANFYCDEEDDMNCCSDEDDDDASIGSIDTMRYSSVSTHSHLNQKGVPGLTGGLLYLYNKPIQVTAKDDPAYCRAALLFNVAMTYHSLSQQTSQVFVLQNAVLLYDLSFQAFRAVSVSVSMNCCSMPQDSDFRVQLFMLAAWNNQSQIHLHMGNVHHTRDMLQEQKALALDLLSRQRYLRQKELEPILNEFIINEYVVRTSITAPIA
jgi:hypothetical protein